MGTPILSAGHRLERYLIEKSAISYAPSLTVLHEMTAKRQQDHPATEKNPSLLALGNPALALETNQRARTTRRQLRGLDIYFRQCSILINSRALAVMAATLANMGQNPVTGDMVFDHRCVKDMLSVMFTCGMYDYSGHWAYHVGVPAKSGVSGGVMAVVNRQLGIATYSPRLDVDGNSVRGIGVCVELAQRLGLHAFDLMNSGSNFLESVL